MHVQLLVSRETSPVGTAVVSVTKIQAGEGAYNVIPDGATFGGTIRSLEHNHMVRLKQRFAEVCSLGLLDCVFRWHNVLMDSCSRERALGGVLWDPHICNCCVCFQMHKCHK